MLATFLPAAGQGGNNLVEVHTYSIADGLPQMMFQNIVQDEDKFVWLATWDGLVKFDGYTFHNFKSYPTDSVRLPYNRMLSVTTGPDHGLWCETYDSRIFIFDTRGEHFIDPFTLHPGVRACEEFGAKFKLPDGVLWLVGRDGSMWRLDGKNYRERGSIRYFQATRPERGETVHAICNDGAGGEWVFTNRGYWVYGRDSIQGLREFRHVVRVDNGLLLTGADCSLALCDIPTGEITEIDTGGLSIDCGSAPLRLADGRVALLAEGHVAIYDPARNATPALVELPVKIDEIKFYEQTADADSAASILWGLTPQADVVRIDLTTLSGQTLKKPYTDKEPSMGLEFVHQDKLGEIWVYPLDGHLCHYNAATGTLERVYTYIDRERRTAPDFYSYMIDDRGNLWGCTLTDIQKFTFPTHHSYSLTDSETTCRGLLLDRSGRLWVASKDFTVALYDSAYRYVGNLSPAGELKADKELKFGASVYSIMEDSRGRIWLGSRGHGLFLATPSADGSRYHITNYRHQEGNPASISKDAVYSIYEDSLGRVWVGTYGGGLNLVEENPDGRLRFLHSANGGLPTFPGKKCRNVRHITCSSNGEMMLGTSGGLVTFSSRFDNPADIKFYRNWCDITRDSTLSNNEVFFAMEDSRHDIYLAIMSGGVCHLPAQSLLSDSLAFSYISRRNGLPGDMVYSIREDTGGRLWFALENAICRYSPDNGEIVTFDRYDFHRPLLIGEAPFVIDANNTATFALENSVMQVDLQALEKSGYRPNIVFCDAKVQADGGEELLIPIDGGVLNLKPGQRNVTVSFVALDYGNTDNISYAYRLKGFNDHWVDNGHNHTASFYALPAGDYVLEVKATNSEGNWSDSVYSLPLHIKPTFIETIWAKLLYLLAFVAVGLLVWYVVVYILRLQRRIDMEQALTALKLRLFTDVSHELRTPLTLIINPIDEVIRDKTLSASSREYMTMAKSNADRMLRLINQFLDIRKIQNSKMKVYLERVDMVPMLDRIHHDFMGLAEQKHISFPWDCPEKECVVYTDVDKVEKIVFNLLSNAFKYTPDGKSVSLSLRREAHTMVITVRDEGPGMEEWQKKSLFKRFETFGRKRNTVSSGIGLSLVKELVDILHGSISVAGVKSEGCTFEVKIPGDYEAFSNDTNVELILGDAENSPVRGEINGGDIPEAATAPTSGGDKTPAGRLTVMVVEDNVELRRMLGRMLADAYNVVEADDGRTALDMLAAGSQPDIIISDIMMPRVDGLELLAAVRGNHEWSHTPFVVLSAKASVYERIEGLDCGADDYLTKPFSASYLRARLRSLIERRSRLMEHFMAGASAHGADDAPPTEESDMPALTGYDADFVKNLLAYAESEAPRPELTIDDMAAHMGLGRTVFNRKVKSLLNCTPVELLTSVRLKIACELLRGSGLTVAEITYRCGFSSPQYFSRVFKARYGCTPGDWRAANSASSD